MVNLEPTPMREIHEIMEKYFEEEKNMTIEEILQNIHKSADELIREKGLKLKKAERIAAS